MKKYILSLLVLGFTFIGFSSAGRVSQTFTYGGDFTDEGATYSPSSINIDSSFCDTYSIDNYELFYDCEIDDVEHCDEGNLILSNTDFVLGGEIYTDINLNPGDSICEINDLFISTPFDVVSDSVPFKSITLSWDVINSPSGGDSTGGNNGILDGVLPGGKNALSGAISGLRGTINEINPYLIYIALGCLGVLVGFVAIKWLMNWTRAKVLGTFNSRKK